METRDQKLEKLLGDEAFIRELNTAETREGIQEIYRNHGVELSREEYEGKGTSLKAEASIRQAYELFDRYGDLSPKSGSADMLMNIMSSQLRTAATQTASSRKSILK